MMFDVKKVNNREAFFIYLNAEDQLSKHTLVNMVEKDAHIQGYSVVRRSYRTFRKDRIVKMFTTQAELEEADLAQEQHANVTPAVGSRRQPAANDGWEICFTGFDKRENDELAALAVSSHFKVRSGVTAKLTCLCCGANAGWRKIEEANAKGALILSGDQFRHFIATGEIPYKSKETDGRPADNTATEPDKLQALRESAAATFNTLRSLPRSNILIAQFVDGYAVGWRFAVKSVFKEALDTKQTTAVFDGYKYETWTQGNRYAFHRGDAFYSDKLGYTDWPAFLKLEHAAIVKVRFECFAGYETVATLDGLFSGDFVPENLITAPKVFERLPLRIESQSYDPGTLVIDVLRPTSDQKRVERVETLSLTQDEFIALLQTGYYWKKEKGHAPMRIDILSGKNV